MGKYISKKAVICTATLGKDGVTRYSNYREFTEVDPGYLYEAQQDKYILQEQHLALQDNHGERLDEQIKDLKVANALCRYFKISYANALEIYEAAEGNKETDND